ncbi:MAG: hypothetical protein HY548_02385, partial [Elusimicrobia bacterium]|nr:hypothetical protein [Elusimicrobiota bacterium]
TREEVGSWVAAEVQKQMEAALKSVPTLRKGLVPPEPENDDVKKTFENLPPEKKLKVALALQHG